MRERYGFSVIITLRSGLLLCVLTHVSNPALAGTALPATALPVPCVATSCGAGVKGFLTSGSATAVQSGNTLNVAQSSKTATLNWSSFNIGAGGKVVFTQPSNTAIALNRIYDSNPSSIFGALSANGQVYLINANGFLFGSTAAVNVGGLLASSLNLSDDTFTKGILAPGLNTKPALQAFVDGAGNSLSQDITVQPGAQLTAADGGRLLLSAPNVTNGGTLTAPDGQVILAAGQKLYLQAVNPDQTNPQSAYLRGLVVEVDSGGTAANQISGNISTPRGNVTLAGLMVNQDGRVSATTSVALNGSVILTGGDTVGTDNSGLGVFSATHGGTVELGSGSLTEVLPEYGSTATAPGVATQLPSQVTISGQQVLMHNATIDAPNGNLTVVAAASPAAGITPTADPQAQIRIEPGTIIDVSGSVADLPMSANLVSVQLRSNEFANDPTQRGGALQSTPTNTVTVTVDARAAGGKGTLIADLTSAIGEVGQGIAQRTESGGNVSLLSEGDVVLSPGAGINVSGGHTTYAAGSIQTTKLVGANGRLYDIGTANPLLTYTGTVNPTFTQTYNKWGVQEVLPTPGLSQYESAYVQGANAGSVTIAARSMALDGALQATTVSGPYQRSAPPAGGTLTIGKPIASGNLTEYVAPSVSFTAAPTPVVVADGAALPVQTLQLPTAYVTSDGFTGTTIFSNTSITLPAGVPLTLESGGSVTSIAAATATKLPSLTTGASLTLVAPRIDVDSSITAVGGHLWFENVLSTAAVNAAAPRAGVGIGDGVTLNVDGQWTNDNIFAGGVGTAPILQNAGSIKVQLTNPGSELVFGNNVSVLASGGAWLQSGGSPGYGVGGTITVDASPAYAALQLGQGVVVQGFGVGTAAGGSFSLSAPRIEISQGSGNVWTEAQRVDDLNSTSGPVLAVYAPLFSDYGFSSVNLTATGAVESFATKDVLTVAAGTAVNAQTRSLQLNANAFTAPSGTPLSGFSQVTQLPLYQRPVTNVSLSALRQNDDVVLGNGNYGLIDVKPGASLVADPGASITLAGEGGVVIGGTLRTAGGAINVSVPSSITVAPADSSDTTDPGYQPGIGVTLASTAMLDVSGTSVLTPNVQGRLVGSVLPGGAVTLGGSRGSVAAAAGSSIDIRGTSAPLDVANPAALGGYTREVVASAGGSLTVSSPESISLLGALQGAAGVGSNGVAKAGSLEVDLVRNGFNNPQEPGPNSPALPTGTLEIELLASTAGGGVSPSYSNLAVLGAAQLASSGIDSLILRAGGISGGGNIVIDSGLTLARQLIVDSALFTIPTNATLSAPFVEIQSSTIPGPLVTSPVPLAGNGALTVSAQQLVLSGNVVMQGADSVSLSSSGDVQLQGISAVDATGPAAGSLSTSGSLAIDGLRVYPDTFTKFNMTSLAGNGATVSIGSTGASPGTPLSADGSVTISADNIAVTGSVYAPFGEIVLTANNALTLAPGSLLSVSGAGLDIPFGQTQLNQGQWIYRGTNLAVTPITGVPTKSITLSAPNLSVQSGATANIAGGGDLFAYEFVPGTGGSFDNLSAAYSPTSTTASLTSSIPNLYAILPATRGQAGPHDPQESGQSVPGQTIYLSGGAGISAGYYTLLPPRYALAAGAVLIQLEPTMTSASGGRIGALADGTPVIAGYLSVGTTGLHTGANTEFEGVAIYPSGNAQTPGYAQKLAAYSLSQASSYFGALAAAAGTGAVAEPADAGTFTLSVTPGTVNSLSVEGTVLTAAAANGRGAQVNISAPELEITAGTASAGSSAVSVSDSVLQSWDASSLTLGGVAYPVTTSTTTPTVYSNSITVVANTVKVDSGVQLSADQIELVAQQSIDVLAGASLQSTSGKSGTVLSTLPSVETVVLSDAAGKGLPQAALLAVSDLYLPVAARSSLNGSAGATITVEQGGTLSSGGALAVDAPGAIDLAGTLNGKGASWSLSSGSVALGTAISSDTLNISAGLLDSLQQAGAVRIASLGNIDIGGSVSLGVNAAGTSPTLNSLTLIGNSIDNLSGANATFGASSVILGGNVAPYASTSPPAPATAGSGSLAVVADALTVGAGEFAVNGFAQTTVQVAGAVKTQGAGTLSVGGDLAINAAEITAAPNAALVPVPQSNVQLSQPGTSIVSTGTLTLGAPTAVASGTTLPVLVGGSLTLLAPDIEDAGAIVAPSGVVSLNATGNLHLLPTASIAAAGTTLAAVSQSAASPGGLVTLTAGGNVSLDAGSVINVGGSSTTNGANAPAGTVNISAANGIVTLAGALQGAAPAGSTGGRLFVNAGSLAGGLASLVANPGLGGFGEVVNVRVHTGDLDLAPGTTLQSNDIVLTADSGIVDIAGTLSAPSAAQRGLIDLSGGTAVKLESGAVLQANGSGSAGRGGEINLNSVISSCDSVALTCTTPSGSITLAGGSTISAFGAAQMGQVVLRAPTSTTGVDFVAINSGAQGLGADVRQAGQVIIEPVLVTATSSATVGNDLQSAVAGAQAFLGTNSSAITTRLTGAAPITVQAGVELRDNNAADAILALPSLDLSANSTAGQVVNVAVRAAGPIAINGVMSDGFQGSALDAPLTTNTSGTPTASGSLSFVAGADGASANPLAILPASTASLTLAPGSVVRTGTGNINLVAAGNVEFQSTANQLGATVYTAGLNGAAPVTLGTGKQVATAYFPTGGGNVSVAAGADVVGAQFLDAALNGGNFSVTGWQPRAVNTVDSSTGTGSVGSCPSHLCTTTAEYGVNFAAFDWNVGALGGGDVSVTAGGKISNLSAATANSSPDGNKLYGAGGGLKINAVGDIGSAQVAVADGIGAVTTNAGLTSILADGISDPPLPDGTLVNQVVGSSFALGNAQMSVWTRQSLQVDAVYNPTFVPASTTGGKNNAFFTYGTNSALQLSSTDGNVTLELQPDNLVMGALLGQNLVTASGSVTGAFLDLPANLFMQALQQDIVLRTQGAILYPSSTGQLALFAKGNITAGGSGLAMSDSASVPTAATPGVVPAIGAFTIGGLAQFQDVIHMGDVTAALITAGGSIDGLNLAIPKSANLSAGKDIVSLEYKGQNLSAGDTTLITAGRDIVYNKTGGIQVGGQGSLDVFAGRNIDLGLADGITTTGALTNPNLPSLQGADVTLAVGYGTAGADNATFVKDIIAAPTATAYQTQLVNYVEAQTGQSGLSFSQAAPLFGKFTSTQQTPLIDGVFFNELLLSGRAANSGTGVGFSEGYAAIDALFPYSRNPSAVHPQSYGGNLNLIASQIYTLSGGNISMLVPGGAIDVGLAFTPAGVTQKPAGQLGIVAEGAGNIDIYSLQDVNVNASRIFTLGGGNILIWSDQGNIDAGNGSKSSFSAPPPVVTVSSAGTIQINFGGSLSGSGIRTIQTNPDVAAGNVDLDAPVGTVNAGDAGIGAAGNVNIAAAHVIGALNINFGGTATGVPSDLSGLGASLSGVSAVASGATTSGTQSVTENNAANKETAPLAQTALSWLEVFVTGLGEENCKQDDIDCLKRQKSAAP